MKKLILGFIIGFIAFPFVWGSVSSIPAGNISPMLVSPPTRDDLDYYRQSPKSYYTDYSIDAPFIDRESHTFGTRPFGLYLEQPVREFLKKDFQKVCLQSYNETDFNVAVTLKPEVRSVILASMKEAGEAFNHPGADGGAMKRYYIESDSDLVHWFWVTVGAANTYEKAVREDPEAPDFVLTVPLHQLERFQFYLINAMTDLPLEGCSAMVDPGKMPGWHQIVLPWWDSTLAATEGWHDPDRYKKAMEKQD